MEKVQRVGISLESDLLEQFDKLIEDQGYQNRSEAVRDLIRGRLAEQQLSDPKAEAVAGVFVVYDHHHSQVNQKLTSQARRGRAGKRIIPNQSKWYCVL